MPKYAPSRTNFTSGEFSPKLFGRFDIARYENGAKTLENFLLHQAGGAFRTPGTKYVAEVKDSSASTRLIRFQYSTTQAYIIEMGNLYMRFYANNGRVVEGDVSISGATQADPVVITATAHGYDDGDWVVISGVVGMTELNGRTFKVANKTANTFELQDIDGNDIDGTGYTAYVSDGTVNKVLTLTTPYTTAQIWDVQYAQSNDVMYLVHPSHAPRQLERLSATSFQISAMSLRGGPFKAANASDTTITPSSGAGSITLNASASIFNEDHVGSIWKIFVGSGGPSGEGGRVEIKTYVSGTQVTADVLADEDYDAGDLGGAAATTDWAEGAFSDDEGYPSAVILHEGRLIFGGTPGDPQRFYGSKVNAYENFFPGTDDDDAFSFTLGTEQVNKIRWLASGPRALEIGTSGGVYGVSSGTPTSPITPSAIAAPRDTSYGTKNILPQRIGTFLYYIQRNAFTVRQFGYNEAIGSNEATDMTLLADHILRDGDGAVDMAYQQSPNNTLWIVRDDGEMACLTRQVDQEVIAWSRQTASGTRAKFESVEVIPVDDGDDQVWVIVQRTINGTVRRYVEYFMPMDFDDDDDAFYVQGGASLDSPVVISGATQADPIVVTAVGHGFSNGDQVKIVDVVGMTELNGNSYLVANVAADTFELQTLASEDVDGSAYGAYVSGGEVRKMVTAITGLDHLEGETVQILADGAVVTAQAVSGGGIALTDKAAKVHAGLEYDSTLETLPMSGGSATGAGRFQTKRAYEAGVQLYRSSGMQVGRDSNLETVSFAAAFFTGTKRVHFPAGYDKEGVVKVYQSNPLPLNVLSIIPLTEVIDR